MFSVTMSLCVVRCYFVFSSRRRHTRCSRDWSSDVCSSDLLLQLKGENAFKVRAYDMGADAFETLPPDPAAPGGLYERVKAGTLSELEGVGKAIDQKGRELANTGKLEYLETPRRDFPTGRPARVRSP